MCWHYQVEDCSAGFEGLIFGNFLALKLWQWYFGVQSKEVKFVTGILIWDCKAADRNERCFWHYNHHLLLVMGVSWGAGFEFIPFHPQQNPVWQVPLLPTGLQIRELLLGEMKSFAQVHSSKTTEPADPWALDTTALNHCKPLPLIVWGHYYRCICLLGKVLGFPS